MTKKIFSGIIALTLLSLVVMPSLVFAQGSLGFDLATSIGGGAFGTNDLATTVISLVNILLGFLGIVAVLIILWGGFQWMTAGGNEEKVGSARTTIIAGIIGLAIVIGSFAISKFVVNSLTGATGSTFSV